MLHLLHWAKAYIYALNSVKLNAKQNPKSLKGKSILVILGLSVLAQANGPSIAIANPSIPSQSEITSLQPNPVKDGIYLYGDTPQPNQVNQGYVIFKKQGKRVSGALYYPQSEFNCFTGTLNNQQLSLQTWDKPQGQARSVKIPLHQMHAIGGSRLSKDSSLNQCQQEVAQFLNHNQKTASSSKN